MTLESVLGRLENPRQSGDQWSARCPAHDDRQASLSIAKGDDGRILLHCFANCDTSDVVKAMGLAMSDLMPEKPHKSNGRKQTAKYATADEAIAVLERQHGKPDHTWSYHDLYGIELCRVCRWDLPQGKTFRPVSKNCAGWIIGGMTTPRPLYTLTALIAASTAKTVYVLEGEKCADAGRALGLLTTTSAHGSKSAKQTDWSTLAGRRVVILPDNDQAGDAYAATVAGILRALNPPADVKIVHLPGLPAGGDLVDFIDAKIGADVNYAAIREEIEKLETSKPDSKFPSPVICSALQADGPDNWIWHGFIAEHGITLLTALWKLGKSTLLAYLLRAIGRGEMMCGRAVRPARALVITEETAGRWAKRRDEIGLGDHLSFLVRPFRAKPTVVEWLAFIDYLGELIQAEQFDLLCVDPLANLWPVADENDAAQVQAALMPFHTLAELCAVLLLHHPRKSDGKEATASRGSGALPAFADVLLELRRHDADDRESKRRILTSYSRWDETPPELVIELDAEAKTYHNLGDRQESTAEDIKSIIGRILPRERPGLDFDGIKEAWPYDTRPRKATLLEVLREGYEATPNLWIRDGTGKSGSPFKYWIQEP